jgi:signal transduction histidine kinase
VGLTRNIKYLDATPLSFSTPLEQAFLSLSLNAVEAMPSGGALMIRSRCLRSKGGAVPDRLFLRFRDTGEGMSEEQKSRLFTSLLRFTTWKAGRRV